ncbi:Polycomb protein suz12 [Cichlidogyrus casuarinus]|uniref:Polycomb protein suz12 n=1 Tax=Cichlidogyrus casuarinus TaxID=1844966 RepID=A0ABD2Q3L7_9PLAT
MNSDSETPSEHSSKIVHKSKERRASRKIRSGLTSVESNLNTEDSPLLQADHEAFIRTFAVNVHLYRYLAECFRSNPILLYRSLRYLIPRNKSPRRTLEEVLSSLRKSRSSRRRFTNGVPLAPTSPCVWPSEVEIVFESWQDSPKETEWTTASATVHLRARFGFCWRRKSCPPDSLLLLSDHGKRPVRIPCEPALPIKVAAPQNCTHSIRLSLNDFLHRARLSDGLSVKRIKSAHLEIHVSAEECRRSKSNITNGGTHPKRNSISTPSTFPVNYATAPLPIFVESFEHPGDVSMGPSPMCLTPGRYELRMGLERDEYLQNADVEMKEGTEEPATLLKAKAKNHVSVNGAGSGRLQWNVLRAMRFSGASTVLDDYERWPTVRFRVNWIDRLVPIEEPEESNGHEVLSQSSKVNTPRKRSWSSSSSDSSHAERVTRSRISSEDEKTSLPSQPKFGSISNASTPPTSSHTRSSTKKGQTNLHPAADKNLVKKEEKKPVFAPLMSSSLTEKVPCTVTYRFLYAGRLQQWTEAQDLICPFCKFNCWQVRLYPYSTRRMEE